MPVSSSSAANASFTSQANLEEESSPASTMKMSELVSATTYFSVTSASLTAPAVTLISF